MPSLTIAFGAIAIGTIWLGICLHVQDRRVMARQAHAIELAVKWHRTGGKRGTFPVDKLMEGLDL